MANVYELDVRLCEIEPAIWRTIEISGACSLEALHFAIQVAMGWTNSHLHQFVIDGKTYGMVDVDGADDLEQEDERKFRLQDLAGAGKTFVYEYDFGDGWEHEVTVNKVTARAKPAKPRCVAGARACPPEDCGGVGGYASLLEALGDPAHEEHVSSRSWSGNFQPERFALPKAGLDLQDSMNELEALADADDEESFGLPKPLVEAVLALEPMQRAALGSLIVGSLATDLEEVRMLARRLSDQRQKPARHGRKRGRS
jgi:Plasmid pRiA4b ORF-3-like protein